MSTLIVATSDGRTNFRPGEAIAGSAMWELPAAPRSLEVRLFWYTQGKGTQDVGIVGTMEIQTPGPKGEATFAFEAPQGPFSYSGRLTSVAWAIELVAEHPDESERLALVLSPTGSEILLGTVED